MRPADGLRRCFREPVVQDLALVNELTEGSGGLLDWSGRVDAVLIIKVDAVRPEAPQRALDGQADVRGRTVQVADLLEVCHVDVLRVRLAAMAELAELRREHHLVAAAGQRPPDELLVKVGAVDLGGVDQGHAEVDGPVIVRIDCSSSSLAPV